MGFIRRHPWLSGVSLLLATILAFLALTGVAVWRAAHTDDARRVQRADLIIVLGAAQYNGRPSPVFQARLSHAVLLFNEGFAGSVLVVGGNKPGDASTEAEAGRAWLVGQGLPTGDVFAEPNGSTTLESLRAAAGFMRARDMSTAFLVSDPWHNLRIRKIASDLGIRSYVSAAFRSAAKSQWTRFQGYVRETFAYLSYRILRR